MPMMATPLRLLWGRTFRTLGVSTTCWGTSASGVGTGTRTTPPEARWWTQLDRPHQLGLAACGAAPGAMAQMLRAAQCAAGFLLIPQFRTRTTASASSRHCRRTRRRQARSGERQAGDRRHNWACPVCLHTGASSHWRGASAGRTRTGLADARHALISGLSSLLPPSPASNRPSGGRFKD